MGVLKTFICNKLLILALESFNSNQHFMFHSNFSDRRPSGEYDKPNFDYYCDKLQPDSEYHEVDDPDYEEPSNGFHYTHPNCPNHVKERTMEVPNEIMMKSGYVEASLNSGGAPRDATLVEVNVGASGEEGGHDQNHYPRYVELRL